MYTEKELRAMDKADEAFAQVIEVGKRIAKTTDTRFYRGGNCWSSHNTWKRYDFTTDKDGNVVWWHSSYEYSDISIPIGDLWCGEAVEFAWAAEEFWNERAARWRNAYALANEIEDYDEWMACVNAIDKAVDEAFEELGSIMENWLDSAWECEYREALEEEDEEVA